MSAEAAARPAARAAHPYWPLSDLRLHTPRLELRVPGDDDLAALVVTARAGVHEPGASPFMREWVELESPRFERRFAQYFWNLRASWSPEAWRLPLAAFDGAGDAIGVMQVEADDFGRLRGVRSATWVALAGRGRGLGTEMRAAALELCFGRLGAERAEAGTLLDREAWERRRRHAVAIAGIEACLCEFGL